MHLLPSLPVTPAGPSSPRAHRALSSLPPPGAKFPAEQSSPCAARSSLRRTASFFPPRYARRAFFTMGASPFFITSASEFFIPRAGAVFMSGRETCSSFSSHPQVRNTAPRSGLSPLRYGLCHPALRAPLARLSGFLFVLFLYEGLVPLAITMPPRHPAGLSSCRGSRCGEFPSVTPAGRSSPWAPAHSS